MARPSEPRKRPEQDWDADDWINPPTVPAATEGGESTWQLWQEESRRLDLAFAPTQPSGFAPLGEQQGGGHATPTTTDALMVLARHRNRVCPRPARWTELYHRLGGDRYVDLSPPPVQPWIWTKLSALQKRLHLREHIEWAERHGKLAVVAAFMEELSEAEWLHMGEG